jgi:hypothetical protein
MLENDNSNFNKYCIAFHVLLDTDQTTKSYIAEYDYGKTKAAVPTNKPASCVLLVTEEFKYKDPEEGTWSSMSVNIAELETRAE